MSQDVAVSESHVHLREMIRALSLEVTILPEEQANTEFAMEVMNSVLSAESFSEVFESQEVGMVSGKDFIDRPFLLKAEDITWRQTSEEYMKKGAFPFWAILNVKELETGEEVTLDTGGQTLMAALFRLQKLGYFDPSTNPDYTVEGAPLKIAGRSVASGNTVLFLRPVKLAAPSRGKKG